MARRKQPNPWEIVPDPQLMNPVKVMDRIRDAGKQDLREIRAEYTRLRDIMQKRIKRGGLNIEIPKLRDLEGKADLAKEFARLNRLAASETTTKRGQARIEERTVQTLQKHKFPGIDKKNIKDFNRFMEWFREKYTVELPEGRKQIFDSDTAVAIFSELNDKINSQSKNASISRLFNSWMQENGDDYGLGDIQDINREARNARRRAARHKKKKQMEQE